MKLHESAQPHRVLQRVHEAGIRHGETATVDLDDVRIPQPSATTHAEPLAIRFCFIGPVSHRTLIPSADGRPIGNVPVVLTGTSRLRALAPGRYRIRDALACSNGRLTIRVGPRTTIERIGSLPYAMVGSQF